VAALPRHRIRHAGTTIGRHLGWWASLLLVAYVALAALVLLLTTLPALPASPAALVSQ
jgi:predicted MFS family arabinose efflux permease